MTKGSPDILEMIRKKASMSAQIASRKDHDYSFYSGADLATATKMALVDTILKNKLIPDRFLPIIKLFRSHLNQQRKAFFASVGSTEITHLGFIQGLEDDRISATETDETQT